MLLLNHYQLAFLKGDTAQMAQWLSTAMGKPGTEDLLVAAQADTEGWYGKLKNARELTRRAMDLAQQNDAKETAAAYQASAALREAESGNSKQARADCDAALKLAPNRNVRAIAALALARAGDTIGAEKLAAELDKTFPLDTLVQRYWLPTIRAGVALEGKDPNRAIESLKVASAVELGSPTRSIFLCPVYLRGEAYLMQHDGNAAGAEFQKFIDHRGLVVNFPWAHSPISASPAPMCCRATPRKPRLPIRISSRSGRTPTSTFPSSSLRKRSTRSFDRFPRQPRGKQVRVRLDDQEAARGGQLPDGRGV